MSTNNIVSEKKLVIMCHRLYYKKYFEKYLKYFQCICISTHLQLLVFIMYLTPCLPAADISATYVPVEDGLWKDSTGTHHPDP